MIKTIKNLIGKGKSKQKTNTIKIGDKVRLKREVNVSHDGDVPAGVTGTVLAIQAQYTWAIWVELDSHFDFLGEWENQVEFMQDNYPQLFHLDDDGWINEDYKMKDGVTFEDFLEAVGSYDLEVL